MLSEEQKKSLKEIYKEIVYVKFRWGGQGYVKVSIPLLTKIFSQNERPIFSGSFMVKLLLLLPFTNQIITLFLMICSED